MFSSCLVGYQGSELNMLSLRMRSYNTQLGTTWVAHRYNVGAVDSGHQPTTRGQKKIEYRNHKRAG